MIAISITAYLMFRLVLVINKNKDTHDKYCYCYFSTLHPILWLKISGDLLQVKFISLVNQFCEKAKLLMVIFHKNRKYLGISFILTC